MLSRSDLVAVEAPVDAAPARPPSPRSGGARRTAPGVREKRGAGAGCSTSATSTKLLRATLCGSRRASDHDSTGAKQASEPSNTLHHSSRVFDLEGLREQLPASPASAARSCCAEVLHARAAAAAPRRTASRSSRSRRTCRPWSRRRCTRARRCRGCSRRAPRDQLPACEKAGEHGREQRGAFDHRRVDHLALAGARAPRAARRRRRSRAACRRRRSRRPG